MMNATPNEVKNQPLSPLAKAAIRYAAVHGLHVHPLRANAKTPATDNGLKDATNDDAQVEKLWAGNPQFNVGLNCGASGLLVLDFDIHKAGYAGGDLLKKLMTDYPTVTSETQSGGTHLFFLQPVGVKLGNSRGNLPKGVDVRGHGGYAVLPPSRLNPDLIDENKIGKKDECEHIITLEEVQAKRNLYRQRPDYQWAQGRSPGEIEFAPLPAFVLDLIVKENDEPARRATTARTTSPSRPLDDVIAEFNRTTDTIALLEKYGYTLAWHKGNKARMVRPSGESASVVVFLDGDKPVSYHHSTSDPLNSAHVRDTFDIYTQLEHGGNAAQAYEAAKRAQGKWEEGSAIHALNLIEMMPADDDQEPEQSSVLDVALTKNLDLGWVYRYVELMSRLTASPAEFHQLAGLVTAAIAIQRRARLRMSFGDIFPNVYGCIVAPSTVYGKTTAISRPRNVLQSAMMGDLLIPSHGSSEGLITTLAQKPNALMIRDEIGTLFGSDKVKYLKDFKQDLTYLFDCQPYSRALSQQIVAVEKPYLNILGATTPARFYSNTSALDWQDGLLPRWLFALPDSEPDFDALTGTFTEQHAQEVTKLAYQLMTMNRQQDTDFTLVGDSYQMWAEWRKQGLKLAYAQSDENAMAIIGRYATYALKFALILAATNDSWGTITPETMQTAISLADNYKHNVYRIITEADKHQVDGSKLQKVFGVIKRHQQQSKPVTSKVIMQFANMKRAEVDPVIEKLKSIGAIMVDTTSGRAPRYVCAIEQLPAKQW